MPDGGSTELTSPDRSMLERAAPAVLLAVLLMLWVVVTPNPVPELVFPSPRSVYQALQSLGWTLPYHAFVTLARVAIGWLIGVPAGILVGLAMFRSASLRVVLHPVIEAIRPLPPVALIPFFITWFGLGLSGQITLVALGCFMVMSVTTFTAMQVVPPVFVRAALALGAPPTALYRTIFVPGILPALVGGCRVSAALAFGLGIAAEFMGAQDGIGFLMMVARRTLNTNTILLGVIIIAIESSLFDLILRRTGQFLCRWNESPLDSVQASGLLDLDSLTGHRP